jgi:hypothetical protein
MIMGGNAPVKNLRWWWPGTPLDQRIGVKYKYNIQLEPEDRSETSNPTIFQTVLRVVHPFLAEKPLSHGFTDRHTIF